MKAETNLIETNKRMIEKGQQDGVPLSFLRSAEHRPCPFGEAGTCCKNCALGPCRINPKKPDEACGICGADVNTIASRNFARMVAAGTSAHSDHGREVAKVLLATARGEMPGYEIKDELKLKLVAEVYGIEVDGKAKEQIAEEVGVKALAEFGQQEGELAFIKRAPKKRQELWRKLGLVPRGVDREVVELMHRTSMGTDQDYVNIMRQASRCALADGWGGSMIGTELQDVLFGTPGDLANTRQAAIGKINLGVLKKDEVNVIIHGHEPILSEMIVMATQDPEMEALAKSKGAKGINLAGICCTANEVLMRHGVNTVGNSSQQELAVITGAVDAMVVDVQCIMQGVSEVAKCYHTKLITTSPKAQIPGAIHIEFDEHNALETAKEILRTAIESYANRGETFIPMEPVDAVVGFSHEYINYMLGGSYKAQGGLFQGWYHPLNQNIVNGKILGVAGVVGCDRPYDRDFCVPVDLAEELIANDILVVQTGCAALGCARGGLMTPEAARKYAGPGLAEVCEAVGIPPVLHAGSCVDNSRILIALTEMVNIGLSSEGDPEEFKLKYLGSDISELPAVGCCPDWIHEKAISIGHYFVASGVHTVFGPSLKVTGAEAFQRFLYSDLAEELGGTWGVGETTSEMAAQIIDKIKEKRKALGIDKEPERILFDMEMRRRLEVE